MTNEDCTYDEWFDELQMVAETAGIDIPEEDRRKWCTYFDRGWSPVATIEDDMAHRGL